MMNPFCMLAVLAMGCCIVDAAAIYKDSEDAPAVLPQNEDSPDVLQMLNALHGETSFQELSSFLKKAKDIKLILKRFMSGHNSPLGKEIVESASKQNIKIKVLLDVLNGHLPDLHDIYRFVTERNESMASAVIEAEKTNPDYQALYNLVQHKTNPEKQIWLATGKKVVLKKSLINEVKAGTYKLTADNVDQVNVLEMLHFLDDNWDTIFQVGSNYTKGENIDFVKVLKDKQGMDVTHFSRIVSPPPELNTTKYTVGNHHMIQDPDVTKVLQDLKAARLLTDTPENQTKAEALLTDIYMRGARVFSRVLTKVSSGTSGTGASKANSDNAANIG